MIHQSKSDAGPIRIPLERMVQTRRSSASWSAITKGRYRQATGKAIIPATRKMSKNGPENGPPQWKSRASSWLTRVTERSTDPNHRPMRLNVFIQLLAPEITTPRPRCERLSYQCLQT